MRPPRKMGSSSCRLLLNRLAHMLLNTFPTIESLNEAFDNKKISALELTQSCLAAIQTHQQLNAWVDINEDASLAQAKAADAQRANHTHTPLTGSPSAIKTFSSRVTGAPPPPVKCCKITKALLMQPLLSACKTRGPLPWGNSIAMSLPWALTAKLRFLAPHSTLGTSRARPVAHPVALPQRSPRASP